MENNRETCNRATDSGSGRAETDGDEEDVASWHRMEVPMGVNDGQRKRG